MKKLFWPAWIDVVMMILLHPHKKEDKSDIYVNKAGGGAIWGAFKAGADALQFLKTELQRQKRGCNAIRWSVLDVGGRALCISGKSAASGSLLWNPAPDVASRGDLWL